MMIWNLEFSKHSAKRFSKLEKSLQVRILKYFKNTVLPHKNPKVLAKPLMGGFAGYWRFRIGEYRMIVDIQDDKMTIVALNIAHRREVY